MTKYLLFSVYTQLNLKLLYFQLLYYYSMSKIYLLTIYEQVLYNKIKRVVFSL